VEKKIPDKRLRFSIGSVIVAMLAILLVQQFVAPALFTQTTELSYSDFKTAVRAGKIAGVSINADRITGKLSDGTNFYAIRVEDQDLIKTLEAQGVNTRGEAPSDGGLLGMLLAWGLPLALILGFWYWSTKSMKGGAGGLGGIFSFGKSKARTIQGEQTGVTFKDVGGAGEAATDLQEVIEFLKNPARFQRLGGKMPKGVLLVGPPGTGKTLLAKATAGEAGVPFFSVSGSEFVEMFVGVGASRVRDLFDQAKKSAPSIIFIDEIDAIGGKRAGAGAVGVHEEREQTLNQLLAEMDGFESSGGVVIMAASNRPEVLDPALLRPGRFDRQISVDLPDLVGRHEILLIHARGVKLAADADMATIARITPGFSGADLANVVNEAALLAARHGQDAVEMTDFDAAIERIVAGSERRTHAMNEHEKEIVATHEAGHALVASLLPGTNPVHKVSIVPRGRALGYTWQRSTEDRYLLSEDELHARLAVMLAGRVAEGLTFPDVSTGAADDLARATDLARRMVTEYGMSPLLGPVRLAGDPQAYYLGGSSSLDARVSPETATQVDAETRRILEEAMSQARMLLGSHRPALVRLAEKLCDQETVDGSEVAEILAQTLPGVQVAPRLPVTAGIPLGPVIVQNAV
jgi:cell division protease FtsH